MYIIIYLNSLLVKKKRRHVDNNCIVNQLYSNVLVNNCYGLIRSYLTITIKCGTVQAHTAG